MIIANTLYITGKRIGKILRKDNISVTISPRGNLSIYKNNMELCMIIGGCIYKAYHGNRNKVNYNTAGYSKRISFDGNWIQLNNNMYNISMGFVTIVHTVPILDLPQCIEN